MKPNPEQIEWMRLNFGLLATSIGAGDIPPGDFDHAMDLTLAQVLDGWPQAASEPPEASAGS